jgi:uncharacterized protein YoxC
MQEVIALAAPALSQAAPPRSTLEQLADVSQIIIALAVIALLALTFITINEVRKAQKKFSAFIDQVKVDISPTLSNINALSADASHVADTVARRISSVDETVSLADQRMRESVELIYARVREFDALLRVVQSEIEGALLGLTGVLHGLRAGGLAIMRRRRSKDGEAPGRRRRPSIRRRRPDRSSL